jgi:hypothetical protein
VVDRVSSATVDLLACQKRRRHQNSRRRLEIKVGTRNALNKILPFIDMTKRTAAIRLELGDSEKILDDQSQQMLHPIPGP